MKKMIFSAAALMIGAVAFAQQTAPAPLLGGATETTTNISGDADANVTENYQFGNANKVRVAQAGTRQSVYTSQDNGSGTGENVARIMQTGEVQPESGVENVAEVKQSGSRNGVQVGQQGDENLAVAHQGQSDSGSEDNVALIQQGTGEQAQYNSAEVRQDGDRNFVGIQQTFDRSSASSRQIGDDNKSLINQNAGPNLSDGHIASNVQRGLANESTIMQTATPQSGGDSGRNFARTVQDGANNSAKQIQNTIADEGVQGETAFINQGFTGDPVGALLDNDGAANGNGTTDVAGQLNDLDGDIANDVPQDSFNATAVQMQTGKMNAAEIHQFGSDAVDGNNAQQNQSGWNQEALIIQNSNGNPNGGNNYAFQDQKDDNNTAGIAQNGFDHKAAQFQDGKRNNAFSAQRGRNNLVSTEQYGNDSRLESYQGGRDNRIKIVQNDGQSALVEQNRGEGGIGGNQANIYQTGSGGDLGLQVETCDFGEMMDIDPITPGTVTVPELCPGCN